jgi:hypothetical protein
LISNVAMSTTPINPPSLALSETPRMMNALVSMLNR